MMENNLEDIKSYLIIALNNGKGSEYVDQVLYKYSLTEKEKYTILSEIQPYHLEFLRQQ